jgi:hydrogenase maturation protease
MWLVVGYGNSLYADDGFGIAVAEHLRASLGERADVQVITTMQLLPELIDHLATAESVIFVDTSTATDPEHVETSGQLTLIEIDDLDRDLLSSAKGPFSHQCSPKELVDATQALYGKKIPAWLCTICGEHLELGQEMCEFVANTIPQAVGAILHLIEAE